MSAENADLAAAVHACFRGRGLTLAVAESCTGGLISDCLTDRAGASSFFVAGAVAYGCRAKELFAGVSAATIAQHGMVSRETAIAMAEGIRRLAAADWSVATTGNLGPDTLEDKERGLVYLAVSSRSETVTRELRLHGDRRRNKEEAAAAAMRLLLEIADCPFPSSEGMKS